MPQGLGSAHRRSAELPNRNGSSRGLPAGAGGGLAWDTGRCWKGALRAPSGRGLGWGRGPGVAAWSPHGCDVRRGPRPACHLCPGHSVLVSGPPPGSASARGSMPRIRPPTTTRAWHPALALLLVGVAVTTVTGNLPACRALQPRLVLAAAEARSLPPCPYTCAVSHLVMADS